MDSIKNKAGKAKKLDKFLEFFPNHQPYDTLNSWRNAVAQECDGEEVIPNLKNCEILICGYPALAGSVLLANWYEEELKMRFPILFLRQTKDWEKQIGEALMVVQQEVKKLSGGYYYLLGEGGLNKALYQLGKDSGIGFKVFHEEIPVRQESIEICEFYDLDPWSLFSAGCALIISDRSREVMEQLREQGMVVNRVGYMTDNKDKFICHKTINSRVNRPSPDGILQVLQQKLEEGENAEEV